MERLKSFTSVAIDHAKELDALRAELAALKLDLARVTRERDSAVRTAEALMKALDDAKAGFERILKGLGPLAEALAGSKP